MEFFDIQNIAFNLFGTPVSYLELIASIATLIAVWLSARARLLSWPIGILSVTLYFFLFYQSQLYPDMFLQIFYFVTNIVGWWRWANPRKGEEDLKNELKVSLMNRNQLILCISVGVAGTACMGAFASRLHEWFPSLFSLPSAVPFVDSFIAVVSVLAQYYMMHKKIECWVMWVLVDIVATFLYFSRDLMVTGILYFILTCLATYALWNWHRERRSYHIATV